MKKIKILIVEDELLTATHLQENLASSGYDVVGIATNAMHAIQITKRDEPDIILLDIKLQGDVNGIETAKMIKEYWNGPIIIITGNSDPETFNEAKLINPNAYLNKPYRFQDVIANINMAIHNFYFSEKKHAVKQLNKVIFFPVNGHFEKVEKRDILFIEAAGSYISIKTRIGKKYMLSANLKTFENQLTDPDFIRVSRKYVINLHHITKIESNTIYMDPIDTPITIGDVYRKNLFESIQLIKTK
jgi:DNA-binding LytR/AlgR family response regulator